MVKVWYGRQSLTVFILNNNLTIFFLPLCYSHRGKLLVVPYYFFIDLQQFTLRYYSQLTLQSRCPMNKLRNELNNGWVIWSIMTLLSFYLVATNADAANPTEQFMSSLTTQQATNLIHALNTNSRTILTESDYTVVITPAYHFRTAPCHDLIIYLSTSNYLTSSMCKLGGDWVFVN